MELFTPLRNGIGRFFAWWFGELGSLVPGKRRSGQRAGGNLLALEFTGHEIVVTWHAGGKVRELGRVPFTGKRDQRKATRRLRRLLRRKAEIAICVPEAQALQTTLTMPQATEPDLREALAFQIDRITPFARDELYFDHWIRERNPETKELTVELSVVPRAVVDAAVAQAQEFDLDPTFVVIAGGEQTPAAQIDLLSTDQRHQKSGLASLVNAMLVIIVLVLAAALVYVPLEQRRLASDALTSRLTTARLEANKTLALQEEIDRLNQDNGFLLERKSEATSMTHVIDELTRLIPDGTWVSDFRMSGTEISLVGFSQAAAALLGLIDKSPMFQKPRFRSPVTQDTRTGLERFNISFEIERGDTA